MTSVDTDIKHNIVAAVLIGRNEGDRLVAALAAIPGHISRVVYVDSGSTDRSMEAAQAAGFDAIQLDLSRPFTAARARNFGVAHLLSHGPRPEFIQFIDGDCTLQPGWIETALSTMIAHPDRAVVCGRTREKFPEASIYNWLIDREWNTPIGLAKSCGGNALIRLSAFEEVGGFSDDMIAGEEPEMCVRFRKAGWTIERIDAEMTLHDAAISSVSQWWKRARRAGHAYGEGAWRHGAPPERHNVRALRSALIWGMGLPALILLALVVFGPIALIAALIWPLQILRRILKGTPASEAFFQTLGKIPESLGIIEFHKRRLTNTPHALIEYK